MHLRYILISVKWAEYLLKSICIPMLHQIIFETLTRIEIEKKKTYLLQNPGSEIQKTFWSEDIKT